MPPKTRELNLSCYLTHSYGRSKRKVFVPFLGFSAKVNTGDVIEICICLADSITAPITVTLPTHLITTE